MYRQTNFFEDLEYQINPDDFYTPSINLDHPKFLPTIKIPKLKEVYKNYLKGSHEDYWEGLCEHTGSCCSTCYCYDLNIYDIEGDGYLPRLLIYPVDDLLQTDTSVWFNITDYFHSSVLDVNNLKEVENECGV
jgi:hypothetical protein|tara:strand:- start:2142 stop:2540 length:399 start_codon:yes stop_codon:yes gene_type:complete